MKQVHPYTCCFTGHRTIPKEQQRGLYDRLKKTVFDLYGQGCRRFVAGGALGFDTLAAKAVLELKGHLPDITLTLILPCADQSARWSASDRAVYESQKEAADEVICLAERYFDGCMQKRNQTMVAVSSVCVAYMTRPYSGAGQTVRMARTAALTVINLAE
jgi:uncharacterized phage-like protein YoqJ